MRVACTNTRLACRQVGEDPFGEERTEKKARITAQEGRQLNNMKASDQVHCLSMAKGCQLNEES